MQRPQGISNLGHPSRLLGKALLSDYEPMIACPRCYPLRYDGRPSHAVGIMEFRNGLVIRETLYVGDPWQPPEWRAQRVEPMDPVPPAQEG
jgi:hypothetical protein